MQELEGKVAVITGGNSGIGFATAKAFVATGARVVIVGRREDAVAEASESLGPNALGIVGDLADLATHDLVASTARDRFGAIDVYVANAGANIIAATPDVGVSDYDMQFALNTRAVFFGVQRMSPLIRNNGSILLVSSIASAKVLDGHAAYAGAKAAVEAFARSWAIEFKDRGIRVNVLSPGPTNTPILGKLGVTLEARPAFVRQMADLIPLGRMGEAEELAEAALYLSSDRARFITGVNLRVDGGISLT